MNYEELKKYFKRDMTEKELNEFKERYANNGKEILVMALEIKALKDEFKELKEMIQPYNDLSATMRVMFQVAKVVVALGTIVGGYIAIKKLLG